MNTVPSSPETTNFFKGEFWLSCNVRYVSLYVFAWSFLSRYPHPWKVGFWGFWPDKSYKNLSKVSRPIMPGKWRPFISESPKLTNFDGPFFLESYIDRQYYMKWPSKSLIDERENNFLFWFWVPDLFDNHDIKRFDCWTDTGSTYFPSHLIHSCFFTYIKFVCNISLV